MHSFVSHLEMTQWEPGSVQPIVLYLTLHPSQFILIHAANATLRTMEMKL